MSSIPDWGTKISHDTQCDQKKRKHKSGTPVGEHINQAAVETKEITLFCWVPGDMQTYFLISLIRGFLSFHRLPLLLEKAFPWTSEVLTSSLSFSSYHVTLNELLNFLDSMFHHLQTMNENISYRTLAGIQWNLYEMATTLGIWYPLATLFFKCSFIRCGTQTLQLWA